MMRQPEGKIYRREGKELLALYNGNFFTASGWPWPVVMLSQHIANGEVEVEDYYREQPAIAASADDPQEPGK